MDITRWPIQKSNGLRNWKQKREKLYSLCKNKMMSRLWYWSWTVNIKNIKVKLKKGSKRIIVPKYNINNIPNEFKIYIKNKLALLNFIDREPQELWTETRNIKEEGKKTTLQVKRKEKLWVRPVAQRLSSHVSLQWPRVRRFRSRVRTGHCLASHAVVGVPNIK